MIYFEVSFQALAFVWRKGPVAKFRCTAWLGAAWAAGGRRRAWDFAGKIFE